MGVFHLFWCSYQTQPCGVFCLFYRLILIINLQYGGFN